MHKQRKNKEEIEGVHERDFQNSRLTRQIMIFKFKDRHHNIKES